MYAPRAHSKCVCDLCGRASEAASQFDLVYLSIHVLFQFVEEQTLKGVRIDGASSDWLKKETGCVEMAAESIRT